MKKSPVDMSYKELDELLLTLLKEQELPTAINWKSNNINYQRRSRIWIYLKAGSRLLRAIVFYHTYIRRSLHPLKKNKKTFFQLKNTGCIRAIKVYFYLAKIGLTDMITQLGGKFDNKLFTNFAIATMLYDASFDVPAFKKYLRNFDKLIISQQPIKPQDEYLQVFIATVDKIKNSLSLSQFNDFASYIQIEHISQLMSIYQLEDKKIKKEDLLKISYTKGGISALALIHMMVPQMNPTERRAIYELGSVMQLIDDISDIEEDLKGGIHTVPNQKLLSFEEFKQLYCGTINNVISKLNLDPKTPNGTLDMLCWFSDKMLEKRYGRYFQKDN